MRAAFGLAIGISAVDALLSAFTAVTVLALVIVSQSPSVGGSLAKDTSVVEIEKTAPVKLVLDIQSARAPSAIVQLASSRYSVLKASSNAQHLFSNERGQIIWSDPPCKANCRSQVTIVAPNGSWTMRLRIAGSAFDGAAMPADMKVKVRRLGAEPNKTCEKQLTVNGQIVFAADFSIDDGIVCK